MTAPSTDMIFWNLERITVKKESLEENAEVKICWSMLAFETWMTDEAKREKSVFFTVVFPLKFRKIWEEK